MHPYFYIGSVSVPAYGAMCALGVIASLAVSMLLVRKNRLRADVALTLFTGALAFGLAGAIVFYTFVTYSPKELIDMLAGGAFLENYSPGFVFYGGFLAGFLAAYILSRILRAPLSAYARCMLPSLPIAHAFGRIGCFLAGCCYGVESELFGVSYPASNEFTSAPTGVPLLPVQLIEAFFLILIFVCLIHISQKTDKSVLSAYVLLYAPVRFFLEFLRGDAIRGAFLSLSTSQWISLLLFIAIVLPVKSRLKG